MHQQETAGRQTLTRRDAADALGISIDHFERHVQPELRVIRSGRRVLIPSREIARWVDVNTAPLNDEAPAVAADASSNPAGTDRRDQV